MPPTSRTYSAVLYRAVARQNLKPHLLSITLANILSGDTCEPIGLTDFEDYLAFHEHSLENLQFLVWFQDYRKRFFEIPEAKQAQSPGPKDFKFSTPNLASIERRAVEVAFSNSAELKGAPRADNHSTPTLIHGEVPIPTLLVPEPAVTSPASKHSHSARISPSSSAKYPASSLASSLGTPFLANHARTDRGEEQPFRQECMRIVATFLQPGSSKELTLDAIVRDTCIKELATNTHPDVFLPIYEEVYHLLQNTSLPRFLAHASTNINLPKQILWYATGLICTVLGIVVAVCLITLLKTPPQSHRAWRLFAVPFVWFGGSWIYSGWRGFCSQTFRRGTVQLRTWELQEVDDEAKSFCRRILAEDPTNITQPWDIVSLSTISSADCKLNYKSSAIAPFSDYTPPQTSVALIAPFPEPGSSGQPEFRRPPVFGPEKVVQDPRIKATHQKIMNDLYMYGGVPGIVFAVIVLSVPSLH